MALYKKVKKDDSGVAAIFVVMVLMALLALISIGFSLLMNREERQALDRQLSTEAFYAAESGVNDARNYIAAGGDSITGCNIPSDNTLAKRYFVNTAGGISGNNIARYSCISVDTEPKELVFTIKPGDSKVVRLSGSQLASLNKLYFGWENAEYSSGGPQALGGCVVESGKLVCNTPQESGLDKDKTGVLRVGVYPVINRDCTGAVQSHARLIAALSQNAINESDAKLQCASRNYFLYPNASSGSSNTISYNNAGDDGSFIRGECRPEGQTAPTNYTRSTPLYCLSGVTNLMPATGTAGVNEAKEYYLRLTAVYKTLTVTIQGSDDNTPQNALRIANAEAIVDVTGVGNDTLRRIQARVPLQNNISFNYGLQSMESVCKLFRNPVVDVGLYGNAFLHAGGYDSDGKCAFPSGSNIIEPDGLPPIFICPYGGLWPDCNPPPPPVCTDPPGCPPTCGGDTCGPPPTYPIYQGHHCHDWLVPARLFEHWLHADGTIEDRPTGVICA